MALACAAATALSLGLATPASAASLGRITNYAPGYVFTSKVPSRQEVAAKVHDGALNACRNDHPATKSVSLISYSQAGPGGTVTSTWDCLG